jgi:hypothetical protein
MGEKMKIKISVFYIFFIFTLISCNSNTQLLPNSTNTPSFQSNECLPPIYGDGFSYPISADVEDLSYPGLDIFVPPPSPWQVEAPLPEFHGLTNWQQRNLGVIQTRSLGNYSEIWIHISKGLEERGYLAVYRTDTKEWKILTEQIDTLMLDQNGTLWGSHSGFYGYAYESFGSQILSKYDELSYSFIPVEDLQNLPSTVKENNSNYYSQVLLDEGGIFWILVPKDGIYKYDFFSKEIKKIFNLPGTFRDAEISSDGVIYLLINNFYYQDGKEFHNYLLKQYNTNTQEQTEIALFYNLEPYPTPNNLLIDYQGRVWLDNVAYFEEGKLFQIERSNLFISPVREFYADYRYKNADVVLGSSDGKVWFLHRNNGMISLDTNTGEWCWLTTYKSKMVEDANHNLWMIADNKLYKLPLSENK